MNLEYVIEKIESFDSPTALKKFVGIRVIPVRPVVRAGVAKSTLHLHERFIPPSKAGFSNS